MNVKETELPSQAFDVLFLANFVHQVVNPLNGIAGTLDNIADGTYKADEVKRKANAARGQLEACIGLVRNLAFFADISSSKPVSREPNTSATSILPQVVIESAQFYQDAAAVRRISIELADKKTQYALRVRPEAIKQVFMNLFDNATKYADLETKVVVSPTVSKNRSLNISVSSIGISIPGSDLEKIFELSYRSQSAKDSKALGSGIGLFICKRIVSDYLGGTIDAEHNSKTRVTTFTIKIPQERWFLR
jgi:signal transduction histidine kinase